MIEIMYYVPAGDNFPQESGAFSTLKEAKEQEEMLVLAELIYSCQDVYTSPYDSISLAKHVLAGMKQRPTSSAPTIDELLEAIGDDDE